MKHPSGKLSFFAVLFYLTACTKADVSSNQYKPGVLTGKWNLVNDSTFGGGDRQIT